MICFFSLCLVYKRANIITITNNFFMEQGVLTYFYQQKQVHFFLQIKAVSLYCSGLKLQKLAHYMLLATENTLITGTINVLILV